MSNAVTRIVEPAEDRAIDQMREQAHDPDWHELHGDAQDGGPGQAGGKERRDYERAGDFHTSEKNMRRQNPKTRRPIRMLLNLYRLSSGYGEQFGRPLLCAGVVFVLSTIGYFLCRVQPEGSVALNPNSTSVEVAGYWGEIAVYSFQVMTFLRPQAILSGLAAKAIYTIESLLGPLFLGLFALAVRQRLKR